MLLIFWACGGLALVPSAGRKHDLCPKMTQLVTPFDKICQSELGLGPFGGTIRPNFLSSY